jgi:hypothetical protein
MFLTRQVSGFAAASSWVKTTLHSPSYREWYGPFAHMTSASVSVCLLAFLVLCQVALAVPGASPVHKATIVPRGHALGMVTQVSLTLC